MLIRLLGRRVVVLIKAGRQRAVFSVASRAKIGDVDSLGSSITPQKIVQLSCRSYGKAKLRMAEGVKSKKVISQNFINDKHLDTYPYK